MTLTLTLTPHPNPNPNPIPNPNPNPNPDPSQALNMLRCEQFLTGEPGSGLPGTQPFSVRLDPRVRDRARVP
eukprot:scaffold27607_cov30-Phaeocystis_antarctica.AAC.1